MLESLPAITPLNLTQQEEAAGDVQTLSHVALHFAMKSKGCDQTVVLITPSETILEIHSKNIFILLHCNKLCCSMLDVFFPSSPLKLMTLRPHSLIVQAVTAICINIDRKTFLQKLKS